MIETEGRAKLSARDIFRKPWMGVIWFVGVMVVFIFGCAPLQYYFGMTGLALTEMIILIMALIPTFLAGQKFSEVFPVKRPALRHLVGVVLMWVGTFMVVSVVNIIISLMFPKEMAELSEGLGDVFTSIPFILSFLVVAVMPAICEEALHRGYILSTMRSVKKDWIVVLIMGVIFGVFHLDPFRFAGTAILGGVMTYIMLKTSNFLYPALLHFINNSFSLLVSFWVAGQSETNPEIAAARSTGLNGAATVGAVLIFACAAPLLLAGGAALLRKKIRDEEEPEAKASWNRKRIGVIIAAVVLSGLIFLSGVITFAAGMLLSMPLNVNETVELTQSSEPKEYTVKIDMERPYVFQYSFSSDKGLVSLEMVNESGERVAYFCANEIYGNGNYSLKPGTYKIIVRVVPEDIRAYFEEKGEPYPEGGFPELTMPTDENDPVRVTIMMILT